MIRQTKLKPDRVMNLIKKLLLYSILSITAISMIVPFIWMISSSLKYESDVFDIPIRWIPIAVRWSNYKEVWTVVPFQKFYENTFIIAVAVLLLQIITCSMTAYSFSKIEYPEREKLFLGYLGTLMIPYVVIMIPQFIIIRRLGLVDNLMAIILIHAFNPFGVFLFRQFFMTIPGELSEAAKIDGCSEFGIYSKIIMPLSKPAIGSLGIFTFVYMWNDFLAPLIYLNSEKNKTLQLGMRYFQTQYNQNYSLMMAAAVCSMMPTILVFILAQDLFVKGIATSGLKG